MQILITMVNGDYFCLDNNPKMSKIKTVTDFINNQLAKEYLIIDQKNNLAIRCSNIVKIEVVH